MGHEGPYTQLRPLAGGREWDATPEDVKAAERSQILLALMEETPTRADQRGDDETPPSTP
ncbi:hypothetical protein [Streptomyces sp. NPDC048248]|uniref:hypothetical protein n=1 Tax=Streptomyces sp. NPDC048248 TaxID=3365523 RepID=UPI00371B4ECA